MSDNVPRPPAGNEPIVEMLAKVEAPPVPTPTDVMTVLVTLPPGSPGAPPHRRSGPAFGYVIKGEVRFGLEGQPERILRAGDTFWEPGGDVVHYQDGNSAATASAASSSSGLRDTCA